RDQKLLYIEFSDKLLSKINDEHFFYENTHWLFSRFNPETNELILVRSMTRVFCKAESDKGYLQAYKVEQANHIQTGFDMPFTIAIVASSLKASNHLSWKDGINEFLKFALYISNDAKQAELREKQSRFFRRW